MNRITKIRAEIRDIHRGLIDALASQTELLGAKAAVMEVGFRTDRPLADDIRDLAEAWADAEKRAKRPTVTPPGSIQVHIDKPPEEHIVPVHDLTRRA